MSAIISLERPDTLDAAALVAELDAYLNPLYPPESRFGLSIDKLLAESVDFFILRVDGVAAGCAGLKVFLPPDHYGEVKRMFIRPPFRQRGLARLLLAHLESHARKHRVPRLRLETGIHQTEAIALYESCGFTPIAPFGPYLGSTMSRCFEKTIV